MRQFFYVTGPFSAVMRPKGFDPLGEANIRAYTHDLALHELGCPRYSFGFDIVAARVQPSQHVDIPSCDDMGTGDEPRRLKSAREFFLRVNGSAAIRRSMSLPGISTRMRPSATGRSASPCGLPEPAEIGKTWAM